MSVDGATIKLSAKDILVLMQALRISAEDGSIYEYANKAYINSLRERLNSAK